jgi:hypothetical protein
MKRTILCISIALLFIEFVGVAHAADNCQMVWPQFGVVSCEVFFGSTPKSEQKSPVCTNNDCSISFSCVGKANCEIPSINFQLKCPGIYGVSYTVTVDGTQLGGTYGGSNAPNIPSFSSATISGTCKLLYVAYTPFTPESKVIMNYQNIYLYDTNPDYPKHKVDASVGCIPNGIMNKEGYTSQLPSTIVDANGNLAPSQNQKPSNIVDSLPTNMEIGNTYSYLYKWIPVSGINIINGKDGTPVGYCGGSLGERKLLTYSKITGNDGCYIIPTGVKKSIECCTNEDCKWKDASGKYVCDPTSFTCSLERPCNSDYECQVIGEQTCINNVMASWSCDLSIPWYPMSGTCKKQTKNVACCSDNDCSSNQYCDKELGCKDRYTLADCPSDKCCDGGSSYKPRSCSAGLNCCKIGNSIVGECKQTCEPVKKVTEDSKATDTSSSADNSNNGVGVIIIVVIVLVLATAGLIYYIKNSKSKHKSSRNHGEEMERHPKNHCTECGHVLKHDAEFCTNCGKKV